MYFIYKQIKYVVCTTAEKMVGYGSVHEVPVSIKIKHQLFI